MDLQAYVAKVQKILNIAEVKWAPGSLDQLMEFLGKVNPRFPRDTMSLLDAARVIEKYKFLPHPDEIDILVECWKNAWPGSGTIRWKMEWPTLELQFSPKHCGRYYTCQFLGREADSPLSFPLNVRVDVYTDMDSADGHSELCPIYNPPPPDEHSEGCPMRDLTPDSPDEAWEKAHANCYCFDDCNCESMVDFSRGHAFTSTDNFSDEFTSWLSDVFNEAG
jgi:hypothetical protein